MDVDRHLRELRSTGFTVVEGAVPERLCDAVLTAIDEHLGIRLGAPSSWSTISTEIDQVPMWGHQSQWEIRQLPHLHRLWSSIWGRDDLWADLNSCRVTPPWREGNAGPLPIHFDVDPRDDGQRWYPGVVALTDAEVGSGGFCCVPSLFDRPDRYPDEWTVTEHGVQYWPDVAGHDIVEVPLARGDLLVFDSRLPHGTVRNDSAAPRAAFYLQLHPQGDPAERAERLEDLEAGRCPPWWRWKPGHDRLDPHEIDLTPLGRRLAGLDEWERRSS